MRAMVAFLFCAASAGIMACAEGVPSDPEAGKTLDDQGGASAQGGTGGDLSGGAGVGGTAGTAAGGAGTAGKEQAGASGTAQAGAGQAGVGGAGNGGTGGVSGAGQGGAAQGGAGQAGKGPAGSAGQPASGAAGMAGSPQPFGGQGGEGGTGEAGAGGEGGTGEAGMAGEGGEGGVGGSGGAAGEGGQGGAGTGGAGGASPVGQSCSMPIEVTLDGSQTKTIEGSTANTKNGFFGYCDLYFANTLLYHVKTASAGTIEATVTPKDDAFDPALYGAAGKCEEVEGLTSFTDAPHDCSETFGPGVPESISFEVEAGVDTWIVVDASNKDGKPDGGPFTLEITLKP